MKLVFKIKVLLSNITNFILSKYPYRIRNTEDSLKYVIENKCSIARYGEGEIRMMKGSFNIGFQKCDERLVIRLREIIKSDTSCMIAIPYTLLSYNHMNSRGRKFWKNHLSYAYLHYFLFIDKKKQYLDSLMTRFYIDLKDKTLSLKYIQLWKKVWDNRSIVFVEGIETRLGIGNDLFSNSQSIERILCPAINAWDKYDRILEECKKIDKDKLVLIALGPTATVLAYDLSQLGYQAIDIGHLDIEYEWYLQNATEPIAITNKYTNEAKDGDIVHSIDNYEYQSQIICKINERDKTYKLGFVVLHYISIEDTIECIESIMYQLKSEKYEIIIVDNCSPNQTGKVLKEKYKNFDNICVIMNSKNLGFSAGNNVGIKKALEKDCDFVAVINNDTILLQNDFFKLILSEYNESHFAVLGPQVLSPDGRNDSNPIGDGSLCSIETMKKGMYVFIKKYIKVLLRLPSFRHVNIVYKENNSKKLYLFRQVNIALHGCCLIFSPTFFKYFQGFEELTFMYGEETILLMNCKKYNLPMIYNPKIKIYHKEGISTHLEFTNRKKELIYYKRMIRATKEIYLKAKKQK